MLGLAGIYCGEVAGGTDKEVDGISLIMIHFGNAALYHYIYIRGGERCGCGPRGFVEV